MFLKFFSKIFCFNENYRNFALLIRAKGPVFCYKIKEYTFTLRCCRAEIGYIDAFF